MKYTPDNISELAPNEVFVFGANERYAHGAGAARLALQWGARHGKAGLQGQTYGIPTKDRNIKTLPLNQINYYVQQFLEFAQTRPDLTFWVTKIGCGLASLNVEDVAPMFFCYGPPQINVILPEDFWICYGNLSFRHQKTHFL